MIEAATSSFEEQRKVVELSSSEFLEFLENFRFTLTHYIAPSLPFHVERLNNILIHLNVHIYLHKRG